MAAAVKVVEEKEEGTRAVVMEVAVKVVVEMEVAARAVAVGEVTTAVKGEGGVGVAEVA